MTLTGYKYTTESQAISACTACNTYYGIPKSPDDITQTWVDYEYAQLNSPKFWYIPYNQSLEIVLGQPTQFEVTLPSSPY
jgi:hypothetical protein